MKIHSSVAIASVVVPGGPHLQGAQHHNIHQVRLAGPIGHGSELSPLEVDQVFVSDIEVYKI